ncbi:hypothetical protein [Actinomadura luteofluorescens]|uniref:hypothetical protein n=1 Tax=Actinomadura luteofluorescens TaxID=46163 RepID=UPI0030CDBAC7
MAPSTVRANKRSAGPHAATVCDDLRFLWGPRPLRTSFAGRSSTQRRCDVSTPLEWVRQEFAVGPAGTDPVVVKYAAHSIQNREPGHAGRDALIKLPQG